MVHQRLKSAQMFHLVRMLEVPAGERGLERGKRGGERKRAGVSECENFSHFCRRGHPGSRYCWKSSLFISKRLQTIFLRVHIFSWVELYNTDFWTILDKYEEKNMKYKKKVDQKIALLPNQFQAVLVLMQQSSKLPLNSGS